MAQQRTAALASHKRARPAVPALPASVAWLEQTTFEMASSASKTSITQSSTEYVLHVHFRPASANSSGAAESAPVVSWDVTRSFEEYRAFRKRLMATLALGHACSAECKWLHSFAKKYFPKKRLFALCSSTALMIVRREKLNRFMHVLRSSLLNRGNHGCAVVVNGLAAEFAAFIEGDRRQGTRISEAAAAASDETTKDRAQRWSVNSTISTTSTDASDYHEDVHAGEAVCDLCSRSLECAAEANANVCSACDTTTLSCGHQFHDGCVLPKLEPLKFCCPTCKESQL